MATVAAPAVGAGRPGQRPLLLWAGAGVGLLAAVAAVVASGGTPVGRPDAAQLLRGLVVAEYVLVGTYTTWRRPASRFGLYLTGVGLLYSVAALTASNDPLAHSVGRVALAGLVLCLAYVCLCFPNDSLGSRLERRLFAGLGLATAFLWAVALPLVEELPAAGPLTDCGDACPENAFRLVTVPDGVSAAIDLAASAVPALLLLGVAAILVGKARSPSRLRRRLTVPLLGCAAVLAANYAVYTLVREAGVDSISALKAAGAVASLGVPLALLVGQVRGRVFAATSLGQLVARIGGEPVTPARVETLLRDALGDPLLTLAVRDPARGGYVDVRGRPVELAAGRPDVRVTRVVRNGRPIAALAHDSALDEGSGIAEGLAASALMLLENTQLVEELRASRARIVESEQRERLRLERNLHDGAQQRLFALQVKLDAARARADGPLAGELEEAAADAAAAAEELRELAHGLYPTVLRDLGLAGALQAAALRSATPVRVVDHGAGRRPPVVEEAVYFCVLEAIQNAGKHAGAGARVTVTLDRRGRDLEFAVADDGAGFDLDAATDGIGLLSMRDRIGAVGGELELESQPGRGTTVRGIAPGPAE
jgi:signal transduction histidine kinase